MSEPSPAPINQIHQVCLLMDDPSQAVTASQLITKAGFSVNIFNDARKARDFLERYSLTAATIIQTQDPDPTDTIRESYQGPVFYISRQKDQMILKLQKTLAELHRRQLKIENPAALSVLKTLIRFVTGELSFLVLFGEKGNLNKAMSFVQLRIGLPPLARSQAEAVPADEPQQWFLTRDVSSQMPEAQHQWVEWCEKWENQRHLVLENCSWNDLDQAYRNGQVMDDLYLKIGPNPVEVECLSSFSIEELCVQPMERPEVRTFIDDAVFQLPPTATTAKPTAVKPAAKEEATTTGWFSFLRKK